MLSRTLKASLSRHAARPLLLRATASSAVSFRGALLNSTSDDFFYARKMDLAEAAAMMTERGLLWRAAEADVAAAQPTARWDSVEAYLAEVKGKAAEFKDKKVLHDREEVMSVVRGLMYEQGTLGLVLGGTSVGKTFLTS